MHFLFSFSSFLSRHTICVSPSATSFKGGKLKSKTLYYDWQVT